MKTIHFHKSPYKRKYLVLIMLEVIVLLVLLLTGCASMSTMQTARTTNKGEVGGSGGAGIVDAKIPVGHDTAGHITTADFILPFLEGNFRYGITDNLDLGFKFTFIGTAVLDAKYQFIGDKQSPFAVSTGFGIGYLNLLRSETKSNIYDFMVPLYVSAHPVNWFAAYMNPKFVLRYQIESGNVTTTITNSIWYGSTFGLRFGKKFALFTEYSYFRNTEMRDVPFNQFTFGLAYNIN